MIINMKQTSNKIAAVGIGLCLTFSAFAQSQAPIFRFLPLLSGYNLLVPTNNPPVTSLGQVSTNTIYGATNLLFTAYNGQVLYSYSNNVNGGLNTNGVVGDAFKIQTLSPDVNGDIVANASLIVYVGNTNWIPVVTTNAFGQWVIPPVGFTNNYLTTAYGGWPLAVSQYPNWNNLATTNYYPGFSAANSNIVTISLYRGSSINPQGGISGGSVLGPSTTVFEGMSLWTTNFVNPGIVPTAFVFPLPTAWTQCAHRIYCAITSSNCATTGNGINGVLINQIGLLQPQP